MRKEKTVVYGSVENPDTHQNHGVVGEHHQVQIAAAAGVGAAWSVGALAAFEHGDDGFDLAALTVWSGANIAAECFSR